MDRFKNNLLLEIGNLQEKSRDVRDRALFLMKLDKVFEDDTWALVKQLHEWPDKMNAHMDTCDERHHGERQNIENAVQKRKESFDRNVEQLTESIQEVHQWGDMQTYRLIINKVVDYQALID